MARYLTQPWKDPIVPLIPVEAQHSFRQRVRPTMAVPIVSKNNRHRSRRGTVRCDERTRSGWGCEMGFDSREHVCVASIFHRNEQDLRSTLRASGRCCEPIFETAFIENHRLLESALNPLPRAIGRAIPTDDQGMIHLELAWSSSISVVRINSRASAGDVADRNIVMKTSSLTMRARRARIRRWT